MKYIFTIIVSLLLVGCGNPINSHTANQYFWGAKKLIKEDQWFKGRMAFGRAVDNARLGGADSKTLSVYFYEYGRASGAICDWKESERGLLEALKHDKLTNGPIHMDYLELAQMYQAKKDLHKSSKYYRLGKIELDRQDADTRDPLGYADILIKYSTVLSKLGKIKDRNLLQKRAREIRNTFKGKKSRLDITPYGKFCHQRPSN